MWVRLRVRKNIQVQGKMKSFAPGDWVEVGKQTALEWIAKDEAEGDPSRNLPARRSTDYEIQEVAYRPLPSVVLIPNSKGALGHGSERIREVVKKAVSADILAKGEEE